MDAKQLIESGLLETYAMGLASAEEAKLVVEMVARYPEVKAELSAIEESLENFDRKNAVEPPAHLKEEILAGVSGSQFPVSGNGKRESKIVELQPKSNQFYKLAAMAASVALIFGIFYVQRLKEDVENLQNEVASINEDRVAMTIALRNSDSFATKLQNDIALLSKPGMKSIELKGMADVAPDAKAMAYANTSTGEVYLEIMNLPETPEGMQYQFWGIVDGKPVDAGMITFDEFAFTMREMKVVPNTTAYAISLEPKGGSQSPTGKIYVMGNS